MIQKEELLKFLIDGQNLEERSIPAYAKHLNNTLFMSGLPLDQQKNYKDVLSFLKKGSEEHQVLFAKMIKDVKESSRDVY